MRLPTWLLSLRAKVLMVAAVPIAGLCLVAYEGLVGVNRLSDDLEHAMSQSLPASIYRGEMDSAVHTMTMWMLNAYSIAGDREARAKAISLAEKEVDRFNHALEAFDSVHQPSEEHALFEEVKKSWSEAQPSLQEAMALLKKHEPEANEKANALIHSKLLHYLHPIDQAFEKLDTLQMEKMKHEQAEAHEEERAIYLRTALFGLFGFVCSLLFSALLSNRLVRLFNDLTAILHTASAQVASASAQIASSSHELSQSVTEQAASLEQTAASIEEVSSMVKRNSENAANSASETSDCKTKADQGRQTIAQMIQSMSEIDRSNSSIMDQINRSNAQITEIVKVIQEIGEKTKVINDIVFQTKLLSFNASVEAARAGEHGKGFSVVAEEVGNLAAMSGNAAKEISSMLEGSIQKVEAIVIETRAQAERLMVDGREKVEAGTAVAKNCGDVLENIVKIVSGVAVMASEISSASQEQAQGVEEITKAISQLDQTTQMNSTASQECATAAESLSVQATALRQAVDRLKEVVLGSGDPSRQQPPAPPAATKEGHFEDAA